MNPRKWRTPSAPMVISCIALFVALSGSAVALQGKNSVDSQDIKPSAVKSADLAPKAVTAAKVDENAISSDDISDGGVLGRDIGPIEVVRVGTPGVNANPTAIAKCPPGRRLLSGGARATQGTQSLFRNQPYYPDDDEFSGKKPIGWIAQATSTNYFSEGVVAYAICLQ